MNTWTLGLLVAVAAFAGCTDTSETPTVQGDEDVAGGDTGNSTTTQSTTTQTTTDDAEATNDPQPQENNTQEPNANTPPTVDLAADTNTGAAPLNIAFTITVGDGDGDALEWTLDFGDGSDAATGTDSGEALHTYEAGNFTAYLVVSDGTNESEATVAIRVSGDSGPAVVAEDEWVIEYEDGTCHAKEAVAVPGGIYIHDRPGAGEPYGSGFVTGGGTWIYEESNDIEGLQVGGDGETGAYTHCQNADFLIF